MCAIPTDTVTPGPQAGTRLLNEKQAAETLGLSPATLSSWRCRKKGPRWVKLGGAVRYDDADLRKYILENQRNSSAQAIAEEILEKTKHRKRV
jgi:predicted DNA-binding transcriptional regulator AlpA